MPRLPVDGKKVIEHRITLGGKERELLADLATSYRIDSISGNDSVVEVLGDGSKVIAALGTVGALLELLGLTDVFDFDDDLKAQIMPIKDKVIEKVKEKGVDYATDIRNPITSILFPWSVPYRAADFVRDRI
tara:strand:+ start:199 stop:594 length:396 start_codon:yes stop_codon:yes gene_type:complete